MSRDVGPPVKMGEIEEMRAGIFSGMLSGARGFNQRASV
jgi:hypothetical protein